MNETVFLGGCPVIKPEGIYLDGRRVIRLDPTVGTALGVGDVGCTGIDLDAWKAANRVKLYPGQRIRWILARSIDDKMSLGDIREQVEGSAYTTASVFRKWFNYLGLQPGDLTETEAGNIDNLKVLGIGSREDMITASRTPTLIDGKIAVAGLGIAQKAEEMPGPILVRQPKIYVFVEFIYRGTQSSMPWPMYNDALLARKWCPVDAQWGLSITLTQGQDAVNVPPETSLSNPSTYTPLPSTAAIVKKADELAAAAADIAKKAAEPLSNALKWAGVAAVVVAGGLVIYYLPRRTPSPEPPQATPDPPRHKPPPRREKPLPRRAGRLSPT